jgi:hypothetical protein
MTALIAVPFESRKPGHFGETRTSLPGDYRPRRDTAALALPARQA